MTRSMARTLAGSVLFTCGLAGLLATAGCSSSSPPSWASALGSGVTIVAPANVAPGHSSPAAVIQALDDEIGAKRYTAECPYIEPSAQAACRSGAAAMPQKDAPYFKNAAIGYVAIDGDKALVGTTGTFCLPTEKPACLTNNDPAAIFSANKRPFGALWTQQNTASNDVTSANIYTLAPCVKIGGNWYLSESA
jgi:hypothetical protein